MVRRTPLARSAGAGAGVLARAGGDAGGAVVAAVAGATGSYSSSGTGGGVGSGVGSGVACTVAVGGALVGVARRRRCRGRGVGVAVGVAVAVVTALACDWRFLRGSSRFGSCSRAGPTTCARPLIGSTFCVTQYVVPPPIARQPAIAATAAPGRAPATGVGSTARAYAELACCLTARGRFAGALQRPVDEAGTGGFDRGDRDQRGDPLAPDVEALVEQRALRAARQVDLRLARLARAGEPERQPRDERLAGRAAVPGQVHELGAPDGHDPLELALDRARREAEVVAICGRLRPRACSATISRWRSERRSSTACAARSTSASASRSISSCSGAGATPAPRSSSSAVGVDRHLAPRPIVDCGRVRGAPSCAASEHLALALRTARVRGEQARLLHGLLDLLGWAPGRHAATCERSRAPGAPHRGAFDQRPRELSAGSIPVARRHHP